MLLRFASPSVVCAVAFVAGCARSVTPDGGAFADAIDVAAHDAVGTLDAPPVVDVVTTTDVRPSSCTDASQCRPGQVCVHVDEWATTATCMDLPASCGATPSCDCRELPGCPAPRDTCLTCEVRGRDVFCGCPCC